MKFKIGDRIKVSENTLADHVEDSIRGHILSFRQLGAGLVLVLFHSPTDNIDYSFLEEDLEIDYELIRDQKIKELGI